MTNEESKRVARTGQPLYKLHVLGAAGSVTGSLNLFEVIERDRVTRFLVDVGLTVENEADDFKNRLPAGIKASDIDFVVISHAHIDHSGYLPKLVKDGFTGKSYLTPASADLLNFMLPDSGYLQEEAAKRANAKNRKLMPATEGGAQDKEFKPAPKRRSSRKDAAAADSVKAPGKRPLYTQDDAKASLAHLAAIPYGQRHEIVPGSVAITFTDAGHILGSAVVNIELGSGTHKKTFCFSGNIGRKGVPLLSELEPVKGADYVMVESTYGDKVHVKRDRLKVLQDIISRAHERALEKHPKFGCGVILIPAFAVGRAQVVLNDLRQLMADGRIPEIPVYVDSPMTIRSTTVHRQQRDLLNKETQALFDDGIDPFVTPVHTLCSEWQQSQLLLEPQSKPVIIVGSSGMAAGGRIVKHLQHRLPGRQTTVLFVGYQGTGTLGQTLVNIAKSGVKSGSAVVPGSKFNQMGPNTAKFGGVDVRVNATIEFMPDYSAHADYTDTLSWLRKFKRQPQTVFLVHGEETALSGLQGHIRNSLGWNVTVPKPKQVFTL